MLVVVDSYVASMETAVDALVGSVDPIGAVPATAFGLALNPVPNSHSGADYLLPEYVGEWWGVRLHVTSATCTIAAEAFESHFELQTIPRADSTQYVTVQSWWCHPRPLRRHRRHQRRPTQVSETRD